MTHSTLFITGHKGFETLLFHEIRDILAHSDARISKQYGGVEVTGGLECVYRLCLYSRLANRVFMPLTEKRVESDDELYQVVSAIDWSAHMNVDSNFAISATVSRSNLDHSQYVALKAKDAIVDQFRKACGQRPDVEKNQPDIQIHINIHQNRASISLDLSGESLHRRGYRTQHSGAPLKEHLAAAMLIQAGWNGSADRFQRLLDPMCGSGTFAIEAALISANIAAGLRREYFGFKRWVMHDQTLWQSLLDEAEAAINPAPAVSIVASDYDQTALTIARANAERAGVSELIEFLHQDVTDLTLVESNAQTLVICNPPYGQRLQSEQGEARLYADIGNMVKRTAAASLCIISANADLLHRLRLKRINRKSIRNGPIDCVLGEYEGALSAGSDESSKVVKEVDETLAAPLRNRLLKNSKHLQRWAKKNSVTCYRVYDADLPEFSFALDRYQSEVASDQFWLHLQEYQAPKTIDPEKAEARIELAQEVVKQTFSIGDRQLFCKTRSRQRGAGQYQKQDNQNEFFQVREGEASLLINLSDYLDSGLFLDHRITRQRVFELAKDKTVLNLFCYTGSVGVQAALGGAVSVLNVDMSANYLKWAEENHAINNLDDEPQYQFLRADIVDLLQHPSRYSLDEKYDLIFLDPPSFSNSSKMQDTLDIVRDHVELIDRSMQLLSADGILIFSTNKRNFKLDGQVSERFASEDISRATLSEDFKRRPGIHCCWQIQHRA